MHYATGVRRASLVSLARWLALASLAWLIACSDDGPSGDGFDFAGSAGAARYAELCQVCHGEAGEGGLGPAVVDLAMSEAELAEVIDVTMPKNDPGRCTGACATEIAAFMKRGLTSSALRCDAVPPSARQLRLLTRREYRATVQDLFGAGAPAMTCARATDCAYRDGCAAGRCEPSACDRHTFVYDPQGRGLRSVHVAGSWNGWPGTVAAGGWALTYDAATQLWTGSFTLPEGDDAYKLVLDERDWVADPRATASIPDGFGGMNSLLRLSCSGGGADDPVAGFPAEARPAGFPFDTAAAAQAVTATHVDAYLATAERLADHAAAAAPAWPCDWSGDRAGCARGYVADVARRAFRRPLTDLERARYDALADADVATALHAILISPNFLYRSELGVAQGDGRYRLTGWEVATALSYTLWGTTPDAALLAAAERGDLDGAAGLEREARRLLADPRARAQLGTFALQWLGGEAVLTADKRPDLFPGFDDATRAALARETRDFVSHVVFDGGGGFAELLTADYTVVDATAARFYGLAAPTGGPGVAPYGDGRRAGVFGHASVLASTAHSDQTSPIRRGLWVRRNLLCQELPPPPPFAGGVPDVDPNATTRDRFAQHTANPACRSCHQYIDGVGFGFEQLDPVGRWRDTEQGHAIDATGELTDLEHLGSETRATYRTIPELARLVAGSRAAPACFVRQYYRFARGVQDSLAGRCARRALEQRFADSGGDVRQLMLDTLLSRDFVVRR